MTLPTAFRVFVVLVIMLAAVAMATAALGDPPHPATGADGTHNCDDFESQADAQDLFESTGGNDGPEEDLDRDDDGEACEDSGLPDGGGDEAEEDDAPAGERESGGGEGGGDEAEELPDSIDTGGGYCALNDCG